MKNQINHSGENHATGKPSAVILDLDGVLTQTARTHREAWKEMFNLYINEKPSSHLPMSDDDYIKYIDGKPRYEGVRSFLQSRNIDLPFGSDDDLPGTATICSLGNLKNEIFLKLVESKGVDIYPNAVKQVKNWRSKGLKCGIVSSSKNCRTILAKVGITDLFESHIDGITLQERGLRGKPEPDMFIEAARELKTAPEQCAIIEDAISGVQSGTRGDFGLVVGVDRTGSKKELIENGADIVVDNLNDLDFSKAEIKSFFIRQAPSLFKNLPEFVSLLKGKIPILFLDYDGTLTPIVKKPEDAILSDNMRNVLREYSSEFPIAIVSGRDMDDVKNLVGIENIVYSGSHGFRISGPDGLYMEHERSEEIVPALDKIEKELHELFDGKIKGVQIDRKRYAIAIHYRNVGTEDIQEVLKQAELIISKKPGFRKGEGKMVVEIRPDIDWHKGKAIVWIMKKLSLAKALKKTMPLYIGDDITDEDVFRTLPENGTGILVGSHGQQTKARYSLKNVYQVQLFIEMLSRILKNNE